jgi:hypothetical protein
MVTEKKSVQRMAGLAACLALSLSVGALTACGSSPTTTTTRTVTTDTTAPTVPQSQTTTVEKRSTTAQ